MASSPNPYLTRIAHDPLWFAHRYDPGHDAFHLRRLTRDQHRQVTFLTDAELGGTDSEPVVIRRADLMATHPPASPLHFIFHSAYCCSTLLARAVDIEGVAMGLKEPVLFNDLIGWQHRGGDPKQVAERLLHGCRLLARPFAPGEAVIVKPSNIANAFAPLLMTQHKRSHALLLYAPLEVYLGSIARKNMWGRLWVRELLVGQLLDNMIDLGFADIDYIGMTDLQVAAIGWLTQHYLFSQMVAQFGPERVRSLNSEHLLADPQQAMARLGELFGLGLDAATVAAIAGGPVFRRHSKFANDYDATTRAAEQRDAAAVHADEIDKVSQWAAVVAQNANIAMDPGAPLLG